MIQKQVPDDNPLISNTNDDKNKVNLLIGVTGSVAAIKLKELLVAFKPFFNIRVVTTHNARNFFQLEEFYPNEFSNVIYYDCLESQMWKKRGDPVLHIELRKWAQCFLIAPLSANTLAKLSNGLCDNLLTLICRAWPMGKCEKGESNSNKLKKSIIICPSMNTYMWDHPITEIQLTTLKNWGYEIIGPISKKMMCGQIGNGAMAQVKDIVNLILNKFEINIQ